MLTKFFENIFGSQADRDFKKAQEKIAEINRHAESFAGLGAAEFAAETAKFKQLLGERIGERAGRLEQLEDQLRQDMDGDQREALTGQQEELLEEIRAIETEVLDEIMTKAYGLVKAACSHLVGSSWEYDGKVQEWVMVPYDVQLYGGMVLHQGKIAEMATGEGKTLVATFPLYLNGLTGRGVHLITHNNYLAQRDAMWMGPVLNFLGLSVGVIQDARQTGGAEAYLLPVSEEGPTGEYTWNPTNHREAYRADVVYATKDQIGFDYLYDNMMTRYEDLMQREFNFAIVDEADSNLIDDARTPLIISGPVPDSTNRYQEFKPMVEKLIRAQNALIGKMVAQAAKARQEGEVDDYEIATELLKATRGAPTNKRLMKLLQEEGVKRQIGRVEADYMREKKLGELDESLYYVVDERQHTIELTEKGRDLLSPDEQALFILPDISEEIGVIRQDKELADEDRRQREEEAYRNHSFRSEGVHNINQLMKAYTLFEKDVQYIISDEKKIVIIDESTGRPQPGRRFSDGLHQALEAKEGVKIEQETQTVATVTLQNLFRMYQKLAGMTGTAETESHELWAIYELDVVVIPTNRPIRRVDQEDLIYRTKREKYNAIIDEVVRLNEKGLPVLVGTVSVEVSETLSRLLTTKGVKHQLLNARYHEKEAQIVSQAGQPGAVTIATNMAGRGTDIKLAPEVIHLERELLDGKITLEDRHASGKNLRQELIENPCGLQVIGTERHEARRIDRQLRGRSGRQGDPGTSRFFLSLEDNLMRLFGPERIASVMDRLGAEEGEVIEHSMVTKSIERAQKKVEARNFEIRKHLLDYDDVLNQQRQVIYDRRHDALERDSVRDQVEEMIDQTLDGLVADCADPQTHPEEWSWEELEQEFSSTFFASLGLDDEQRDQIDHDGLRQHLGDTVKAAYDYRLQAVGEETFRQVEKAIVLHTVDTCWQEHLFEIDELKEGVGFVGVGGKNPLIEYKKGAYEMFEGLINRINQETVRNLFRLRVQVDAPTLDQPESQQSGRYSSIHRESTNLGFAGAPQERPQGASGGGTVLGQPAPKQRNLVTSGGEDGAPAKREPVRVEKVKRNDPCPCGSGKKYKKCHGQGA